jgi:hypothetical protein
MVIFEQIQDLFRPVSDSLPHKNRLLDDDYCIEIVCQDELPSIEAVASFSPSSSITSSSSSTIPNLMDQGYEENSDTEKESPDEERPPQISNSTNHLESSQKHLLSPGSPNYQASDYYISKDDLDLLMLAPEELHEYEQFVRDEEEEKRAEQKLRKALIHEELDILIRKTVENDELQGHEFEPEAVEALGIAANRVAYLKKYYDVASCEYIYVPSVAYTIMNGSLLEEAANHYFGKSDEFLVAYAAGLGSTIISQKEKKRGYLSPHHEENSLAEDLELRDGSDDDDDDDDSDVERELDHIDHSQLAKLVWGVSPRASPVHMDSRFNDWERRSDDEVTLKKPSKSFSKSYGVVAFGLFLAFFGFYFQKSDLKFITIDASLVFSEGRDCVKIILDDFKGLPAAASRLPLSKLSDNGGNASEKMSRPNLRLISHEVSHPQGWGLDNASNTKETPNEEKVLAEAPSTRRNNIDDVGVDQRVLLRNEMQETEARRPIVSNLLRNEMQQTKARRPIVPNLLQNEMQETKARRPIVSNLLY